jgi:hypothetical protein
MEGGRNTNYWPGFVDALTNVVIAMVFVIIVLALSLSFSAQLLAKRMAARIAELERQGQATQVVTAPPSTRPNPATASLAPQQPAAPAPARIEVRGNEGSAPAKGGTMRAATRALLLEFQPTALTLDDAAAQQLGKSLDAITNRLRDSPPGTRIMLVASGPEMALSDNQRAGFIRTMAVRNALLQKGIPGNRIGSRFDLKASPARPTVSIALEEAAR